MWKIRETVRVFLLCRLPSLGIEWFECVAFVRNLTLLVVGHGWFTPLFLLFWHDGLFYLACIVHLLRMKSFTQLWVVNTCNMYTPFDIKIDY
jgi:hypothetical protein